VEKRRGGDAAGTLLFAVYGLLVSLAVWLLAVPFELVRVAFGRASGRDLRERLGWETAPSRSGRRRLLLHAVSVGETAAAAALLERLLAEEPGLSVVLSVGNREGRGAARRLAERYTQIEATPYLPWDRPRAVRRFLAGVAPDVVAVVETEIWPNLFRACRELRIPLAIVNGRIYPRDVARYHAVRFFFRRVLAFAAWIGVASAEEWDRFLTIGARGDLVHVAGNLKFDVPVPASDGAGRLSAALAGDGFLVVAGSTHAPEEKVLLDAASSLGREARVRLVLAPRRVGRTASLLRVARRRGLKSARFSRLVPEQPWDVLVLDEMGLLAEAYSRAHVAFVGGSLARRGGHNPLEPAAQGVPVLMGPHVTHVADLVEALERSGGLLRLKNALELPEVLRGLLADPARRSAMGANARAAVAKGRGASAVYARALLLALTERP
jgi:3-deoxy-D-manno-octulosonic-acid transferase